MSGSPRIGAPRATQVAVCGPGDADAGQRALAETIGAALARGGATVVCGGLGGCMEAVCRGAKGAGGRTVGILPGYDARAANAFVDAVVCTGMGQARNAIVAASGVAVIAVAGGMGTISEVALALRLGRPVVLAGEWPAALVGDLTALAGPDARLRSERDPDEAVRLALGDSG